MSDWGTFDGPSCSDGLQTDYGLTTPSIGANAITAASAQKVTTMAADGFTVGLGYNQGWDMTSVDPLYSFQAPTGTALANAAAHMPINVQLPNSNPVMNSSTSPDKTNNAMLWLAAAGVLLAMAGFFKERK